MAARLRQERGPPNGYVFTSLIGSAHREGLEPWRYLRDLLCLLPTWPAHRVPEFAPAFCAQTAERDEVILALEANPFRLATDIEADGI